MVKSTRWPVLAAVAAVLLYQAVTLLTGLTPALQGTVD